jgi:hypothetical protein
MGYFYCSAVSERKPSIDIPYYFLDPNKRKGLKHLWIHHCGRGKKRVLLFVFAGGELIWEVSLFVHINLFTR